MKKIIVYFLINGFLIGACDNVFIENEEFNLQVLIQDSQENPLAGAKVCLYNNPSIRNSDGTECEASLLSAITGSNGIVEFLLPEGGDINYYVTAVLEVGKTKWTNLNTDGLIDFGDENHLVTVFTPGELDSSSETTGLKVLVQDENGIPVAGASVCLFQDPVSSMVNAYSCDGSLFTATSDEEGIANLFNLREQVYYINATAKVGQVTLGNNMVFESPKLVPNQLTTLERSIIVGPVSTPDTAQFLIVNVLENSQNVANAKVCLYLEEEDALASTGDCSGGLRSLTTDDFGLVIFPNLDTIKYHITADQGEKRGVWLSEKALENGERRLVQIGVE